MGSAFGAKSEEELRKIVKTEISRDSKMFNDPKWGNSFVGIGYALLVSGITANSISLSWARRRVGSRAR
jgi:hypothetical protein